MLSVPRPPRSWLRLAAIVVPLLALVISWSFILVPVKTDRTKPENVARLLVDNIQDNNPNKAYQLMSSAFQKKVTPEKFAADTVTPLSNQLPASEPQMFSIAYPSDGKKEKARVLYNIADDGTAKAQEVMITMSRNDKDWFVERLDTRLGKAVRPAVEKP